MACPSSGAISMLGIFSEKNEDDYTAENLDGEDTLSLRGFSSNSYDDSSGGNININSNSSDKPDGSTPHSMSEFHGYDHDAAPSLTSYTSSTVQSKSPCGLGSGFINQTYYSTSVSSGIPANGSSVYSDSGGSSALSNGNYKVGPHSLSGDYYHIVVSSGVISSSSTC